MKFFRNPEIKFSLLIMVIISALLSTGAFIWYSPFGFFTMGVCALFIFIFTVITYIRYRRIFDLSAYIDRLLHEDDMEFTMDIEGFTEGELSVLQSELYKMTVRLREQQSKLKGDKAFLADSIADISHQIRTPLTSINLMVEFLGEPGLSNQRRYQLVRDLSSLLDRIDWLITALLKLSKLDADTVQLQKNSISLQDLIARAISPLAVTAELREQKIETEADGQILCDIAWTSEAISNIVKNCIEHTPAGGTISIHGRETALYSEITISDTGNGFDKEDLPHIFERFYKGKNSSQTGFGIGLALARMIITKQNGIVKAENRTKGGAKFTIRIYKGTV